MNARTAKLIRRFCTKTKTTTRSAKAGWNATPRNERWRNRMAMEQAMGNAALVDLMAESMKAPETTFSLPRPE